MVFQMFQSSYRQRADIKFVAIKLNHGTNLYHNVINWLKFHGFFGILVMLAGVFFSSSLLLFYYIVRILSMPKFYVFWSLFPLLKSIRPRYVASFFAPITMQCCSSVNTIPIGWLRSIKNLFWISLVVHVWFGGNSSTVTMTWLFQLASCLGECRFRSEMLSQVEIMLFAFFFLYRPSFAGGLENEVGLFHWHKRLLRTCCITIYQLKASVQNLLLVR